MGGGLRRDRGAPLHPAWCLGRGLQPWGLAAGGGAVPQGPIGTPFDLGGATERGPGGEGEGVVPPCTLPAPPGGCREVPPSPPPSPAPHLRAARPVAGGRSACAPRRGGTPSSPSRRDTGDAGWPSSAPAARAAAGPCRASPAAPRCPHPVSWPCGASVTPPPPRPWTVASSSGSQVGLASGLGAQCGGLSVPRGSWWLAQPLSAWERGCPWGRSWVNADPFAPILNSC